MYPDPSVYTLLSVSVVSLGIVFAVNYNRNMGVVGLRYAQPFIWFAFASWYSVVAEFVHAFFSLKPEKGLEPVVYVLATLHSLALVLLAVSLAFAFDLMNKIAVDDSIESDF